MSESTASDFIGQFFKLIFSGRYPGGWSTSFLFVVDCLKRNFTWVIFSSKTLKICNKKLTYYAHSKLFFIKSHWLITWFDYHIRKKTLLLQINRTLSIFFYVSLFHRPRVTRTKATRNHPAKKSAFQVQLVFELQKRQITSTATTATTISSRFTVGSNFI